MHRRSVALLKKAGKPMETPEYKYPYTPWDDAGPTAEQIAKARTKFTTVPFWKTQKPVDVTIVPANMYTYGKEGMTLPISIFKDQVDPVIGPEWTYPGIYEQKGLKAQSFEELARKQNRGEELTYWERRSMRVKTNYLMFLTRMQMTRVKNTFWSPLTRERGKKPKSRAETAAQKKAESAAAMAAKAAAKPAAKSAAPARTMNAAPGAGGAAPGAKS